MNTKKSNRLEIKPARNGFFELRTPLEFMVCSNSNEVGEYLEPLLWPMIRNGLETRKKITITVEYGTD